MPLRTYFDAPALDALLGVMSAAGTHDLAAVNAGLDAAEAALGGGFHQSRADIHAAREAAEAGHWKQCWGLAYAAICGLTHAFPPDPSRCPPAPNDATPLVEVTCACGQSLRADARFCHQCGAPATS